MSNFNQDLGKEIILGRYLDDVYRQLNINLKRVTSIDLQNLGVDLMYTDNSGKHLYIDEKAQLDYINSNLPTFTFELSYLKNSEWKKGWFLDFSKATTHYFLITNIMADNPSNLGQGIKSCNITSVNREKLINHLSSIGLTNEQLKSYDNSIRQGQNFGKNHISELNPQKEGLIYFTKNKSEKPINLQLRLKYLIETNVAKQLFPPV